MAASFIEERRTAHAGSGTRELAVTGKGPTVLLLHGFGDSADTWRPLLHLLRDAGQAAVAVDLPGFGEADPLTDGELLPQLDAFVAEAIRRHGRTEGVVVAGNSLGAAAAARAGRNSGLPVAAVLTLGVAGVTWNRLTASVNALAVGLGLISGFPVPEGLHRRILRLALSQMLYGERAAVDPQVVARFAERVPDLRAAQRLVRVGARFKAELDRTPAHGGVGVPMTVIHGARDRLVPVSASRILHQANPGSRLVVLDRAGHCPQLDAAPVVLRHALELVDATSDTKEIS